MGGAPGKIADVLSGGVKSSERLQIRVVDVAGGFVDGVADDGFEVGVGEFDGRLRMGTI